MADTPPSPVTFEALSAQHVALLNAQVAKTLDPQALRMFVAEAAAAGVQIDSIADRDAVRAMINYWTATLARLPEPEPAKADKTAGAALAVAEPPVERPALATFDASQSPTLDDSANPFVGLAAFDVGQSANFFGRDQVVHDLMQHVLASPLVVVSGASGTGKSSLARAGLTRALQDGAQTRDWTIAIMTPGRDPVASLAAALAPPGPGASDWIDDVRAAIDADPAKTASLVGGRMAGKGLVLIIDQMEELFSLCLPEDRDRAARAIAAIAALPSAHVVITIRDEYLETERATRILPDLDLAAADEFRIPPLNPDDIRAAITEPAKRAGLVFQDGVVDRIVADVGTDPAGLPLLQYALLRMWRRREGNRITMRVYEAVGGPATALSNAAQEIYDGFGTTQARDNTALIFQQLVKPSLLYEFVRDRVTRSELERLLSAASIDTVLKPFVDAALIRVTRGSDRSEDRIEIVHEALIRNWELLRRWAIEVCGRERAFLALDAQAQRWGTSGRARGHLLFGQALNDAEKIRDEYRSRARVDPVADARVARFLQASRIGQRRLWTGAAVLLSFILALVATIWLSQHKRGLLDALLLNSQQSARASEAALADARDDDDEARQFVQMLLSRGSIQPDELPPSFVGMTARATVVRPGRWPAAFDPDFLKIGRRIGPALPAGRYAKLTLPNLVVYFDTGRGLPVFAAAQLDRTKPRAAGRRNGLYALAGLGGQPDEVALAAAGLVLARLIDMREIAWGAHAADAASAANLLPVMVPLKQIGEGSDDFGAWGAVDAWLRLHHNPAAERVIFLAGAVPGDGPPGTSPPDNLWKMAISVGADGKLVVDAAMLPGASVAGDLPGRTTIEAIAKKSHINFNGLLQAMRVEMGPTPAAAAAGPAAPITEAAPQLRARVFIQVHDVDVGAAAGLQAALATAGFRTPGIQKVDACIAPQLRYYFPEDAADAAAAAQIAANMIGSAGVSGAMVAVHKFDPGKFNARPGNIELWLCGAGTGTAKEAER